MGNKKENKDDLVAKLQQIVKDKKAEITQIERPNYYTNLSYPGFTGVSINLNTVNSLDVLTEVLAGLLIKKEAFNTANTLLGLHLILRVGGYTYEEWEHDIKAKVAKILVNTKKQELEILEKRLAALESPELKAERELADIGKSLGL